MERLRKIMGEFTDVKEQLESTSCVLEVLAEMYEFKDKCLAHQNVVVFKMLVDSVKEKLEDGISELDIFILENKNE